jgi:monothiol glutaredoxin
MNDTLRAQIDDLVTKNKVVLFMKGSRHFPQCGFSATVVQILDARGAKYETVNVLSSPEMREGIKEYSSWPTIPQLYVDGKFVGGCDIVRELDSSGELVQVLGGAPAGGATPAAPAIPKVTISKEAREAILEAQKEAQGDPLRVAVGPRWDYDLVFDAKQPGDVVVEADGLTLVFDRESAARAGELTLEYVAGQGFRVDSSKAPARVRPMDASELKKLLGEGAKLLLLDVRPEGERALASIPGHTPLSPEVLEQIVESNDGAKVVVYCHHGHRSMNVAQQLVLQGVAEVYNLVGGVEAYADVDSSIGRY